MIVEQHMYSFKIIKLTQQPITASFSYITLPEFETLQEVFTTERVTKFRQNYKKQS
jgi:hypothetical protein